MALSFFKKRDIDEMDINDIPEEFINYFESLDDEGKSALIGQRRDLADALGFSLEKHGANQEELNVNFAQEYAPGGAESMNREAQTESSDLSDSESDDSELTTEPDDSDDELSEKIKINAYAGQKLDNILKDNMSPFEVLAIGDNETKCMLHHTPLREKNIRFNVPGYPTFGLNVKICRQCQRLYMEISKMDDVHTRLMARKIPHTFYNLDTTKRYLQSQIKPYQFTENSKLFIQNTWVEESPTCVCTLESPKLLMIPCEKTYKGRTITFTGYQCEKCKHIFVRSKAAALEIDDECTARGIPGIKRLRVRRRIPNKECIPQKKIQPDYFIKNGFRLVNLANKPKSYYKLSEDDILVVSDVKACMLDGHSNEDITVLIHVDEKKTEERNLYACEAGFCIDCMKYYITEEDYNAIYALGRPEVTTIIDLDKNNYRITSGSEFNVERGRLKDVEDTLQGETSKITSKSDYVSKYATGDYDDGGLKFAKQYSVDKYGDTLEALYGYMPKPYSYRVDITSEDESETFYIGASDIVLNGRQYVISANSAFGHDLVNYQTTEITKNGKKYGIKLTRQFDIGNAILYSYSNVRTDEDIIFKKGITDPFLIRVLNMRKKQHNLTDIFVTIQENQNKIVNTKFDKNIIVQGCAGSGKTMVMLHRLSALIYKNKGFNFSASALILTPNEHFSLHIKGLSEDLQIRYIRKLTVEQYYLDTLLEYSKDFEIKGKISTEMIVPQDFVNYVYSDLFKNALLKAFNIVIGKRNALSDHINKLAVAMGIEKRVYTFVDNEYAAEQLRSGVLTLKGVLKLRDEEYEKAQSEFDKRVSRKEFLTQRASDSQQFWMKMLDEVLPRTFEKITEYQDNQTTQIAEMQAQLEELRSQRNRGIESEDLQEERRKRITLNNKISTMERQIDIFVRNQENEMKILNPSLENKTPEEVLDWIREASNIVSELRQEVRLCDRLLEEYKGYEEELTGIDIYIAEAKGILDKAEQAVFSEDIKKKVEALEETVFNYTLQNTYQMVFDEATSAYRKDHSIEKIRGKYHRYDLYARLLFAQHYFKHNPGRIRFMCIDEGQDICVNEYRLIRDLNNKNTIFNIFGDVNQLMKKGRGISNWGDLDKIIGTKKYSLNENYRNTNQITRFCNKSFEMDVKLTGVDGKNVREILRKDLESELASLGVLTERIALLLPRKVNKKLYLKKDLLPETLKDSVDDKLEIGHITCMYVDEIKGIEFDKAYVVSKGMSKNEKYIAYTRALSELIIVVDEKIKG